MKKEDPIKKTESLKYKLPAKIITILIIVFLSISSITITVLKQSMSKSNINSMEEIVGLSKTTVESFLETALTELKVVVSIPEIKDPELSIESKIDYLVKNYMNDDLVRIDIVDKYGNGFDSNGEYFDGFDENSYNKIMDGNEYDILGPYVSTFDGNIYIKYTIPIKYNEELVGVISFVKSGESIQNFIQNIGFLETGYALIIDSEGYLVADKDFELVKQELCLLDVSEDDEIHGDFARLANQMLNNEECDDIYNIKGIDSYVRYSKTQLADLNIALVVDKNDFLSMVTSLRILMTIVILIGLIIIAGLVVNIIIRICNRLSILNSTVKNFASGDFSIGIPEKLLNSKDEIGSIFNSINHSKESLNNIILRVKENSKVINNAVEVLLDTYKNINIGNKLIADEVKELDQSNSSQYNDLIKISGVLSEFNTKFETVLSNVKNIDTMSKNINEKAVLSSKDMNQITVALDDFNNIFKEFIESLSNLTSQVNSINDITETINEISEQTGLLALNATIEASRAGEAGRGFAIVADEITKLSQETRRSSEEIAERLKLVVSEGNSIKESTSNMAFKINNQEKVIANSIKTFEDIVNLIEDIYPKINEITMISSELNKDKNEIIVNIEDSAKISEDISVKSSEMSKTTRELSESSESISRNISEISTVTNSLENLIESFLLKEDK